MQGKRIVVCVGGGIAAYKAVILVRALLARGARVRVAMTDAGARFVGPVTFAGITGEPAIIDLWDPDRPGEIHVELASFADAIVVVPATANLLARAARGMSDDVVLATLLCTRAPTLFAPAMHEAMWTHPATAESVAILSSRGARFVGPVYGPLASGAVGVGRMAEPEAIADAVASLFTPRDLEGLAALVTAGPTVEDLDPVRFLGNRSTGKMGFAIASRAAARGANTTLVAGPVTLPTPSDVHRVDVRTALEMHAAVLERAQSVDAVVMAAAVADYRPAEFSREKIKKRGDRVSIELVKNPDILAELGASRAGTSPVLVGFAVETGDVVAYARDKLRNKRADFVVANSTGAFGRDDNEATWISEESDEPLGLLTKEALADRILDRVQARIVKLRNAL